MKAEREIFQVEIDAGLEPVLFNPISLATRLQPTLLDVKVPANSISLAELCTKATKQNQIDLHPLQSILVTTCSNLNDDHFDRFETWAARNTPEDKPFNYEHDQSDIIGHITGCFVVDDEMKVIADDTSPEDLPEKFHIVVNSVLYKKWEDATLQRRMNQVIAEIAKGEWYVSMEALFNRFDYLLVKDGESPLVKARNNESAFLTKHLRAYGGAGEWNGYRVHRLLRNFVFSGKGLVRNPGNPESVILLDEVTNAENKEVQPKMADNANIEHLNTTIAELKASVALLTKERDDARAQAAQRAEAEVKNQLETLKADVKARDELTADLKTKLAEAEAKYEAQLKAATELTESATNLKAELAKIQAEKALTSKVSKLVAKGMNHEDATAKAEVLKDLNDAQFEVYLEAVAKTMQDDNEDDDPEEEVDDAAANAQANVLNNAKPSEKATPSPAPEAAGKRQKTVAALSAFVREKSWEKRPAKAKN